MGKENTEIPEWEFEAIDDALGLPPDDLSRQTAFIESQGPLVWLTTMFPFAFDSAFSADHKKYWDLKWSVLMRIREQKRKAATGDRHSLEFEIYEHEWTMLAILARGLGKSATIEASAVMRGALIGGGYCLYVCETQDQAEEHISNARILITHEDSRLSRYYPGMVLGSMAIKKAESGEKLKDGQDIFITQNGWICRAKGLNASLRGLRIGNKRPDDIKLDDVDGVNDSIQVSNKKIKQIAASIIPTRARRWTTFDFGQNLIGAHSVMSQTYNGKAGIFAARTVVGITNAFEKFEEFEEYESYLESDGRVRYRILPAAKPTWAGLDIPNAQLFLNDSGLDVFLAEYMNSFDHLKQEKVYHEFDESRHLITRAQFEKVFGVPYIPAHWRAGVATDLGYSATSLSAWSFIATSAANSALPNHHFLYRGRTFESESIDDQAEAIWEDFFPDATIGRRHFEANQNFNKYPELLRLLKTKPRCAPYLENYVAKADDVLKPRNEQETVDEKQKMIVNVAAKSFTSQIKILRMSHEKSGEQKTLAQKYGLPIQKTTEFKAADGVTETNHLLRGDYTTPHPFFPDEILLDANGQPSGKYKLGRPYLFFIIENEDQRVAPTDDKGLMRFREQLNEQRWTEEVITEGDRTVKVRVPGKTNSDCGDSLRMLCAQFQVPAAERLTQKEAVVAALSKDQQKVLEKKGRSMGEQLAIEDALKEKEKVVRKRYNPSMNSLGDEDDDEGLGFSF